MLKSTHIVEVVSIKKEPHPMADSLSVVNVYGYTVCVRTSDWEDGQLAAYVPPDSLVDTTRPEFAFLAKEGRTKERITVKKLRGIVSMGLLVPAPQNAILGENVADLLGVEHYEPPVDLEGGEFERGPSLAYTPCYDVDSIRGYPNIFQEGEDVYVSEKIHGASARYTYHDGRMYVGSRTSWMKEHGRSIYWNALKATPGIQEFCEKNPGVILYGEVYGHVKHFNYDSPDRKHKFIAFDILQASIWLNFIEFKYYCDFYDVPRVPKLYVGQYNWEYVSKLAEGNTTLGKQDHVREGCVIKPLVERTNPHIGRVMLKLVGNDYLIKQGKA